MKTEGEKVEVDLSKWLEPFDEIKMSVNVVEFVVKFFKQNKDLFENENFDQTKLS